ncbi:MAG: ROK family protein [Candidatus Dadabacteria bacterium]|nr:ROK family protein [Candidatus Dadabacteria bacterium]NIS10023.1 ROK family protein [Candidatus Dadabacteria bacterium]NIV42029.1 ROK family protein [Candidatus Dadabacteria bacterium]NIX15239.1 ROK family protein [Candidatus Dadabacteria bacterium]NIY22995.1 ROK family protein [Candidatus Dadabacteria bacterium]
MSKHVIGIDIGGTNLRGAVVDSKGKILMRHSVSSDAHIGIGNLIDNMINLINSLRKDYKITGIGIGMPGIIDAKNGVITQAPNIKNAADYPIRKILKNKIKPKLPIFIENDANCAALGEYRYGAGIGLSTLIMITLGTGVGGGIILDGKLWNGAHGMGGEIGHIKIYPGGNKCNCGHRGCLESYASLSGMKLKIKKGIKENRINKNLLEKIKSTHEDRLPELFFKEAKNGNRFSKKLWEEFGTALGLGISTLTNLLNPEIVVIGGGIAGAWQTFIPSTKKAVKENTLIGPYNKLKIDRSKLKDDAGILGAASLVI